MAIVKRRVWIVVSAFVVCGAIGAQQPDAADRIPLLSLILSPQFTVPLGRDADVFAYGGGAELAAEYRMPFLPLLFVGGSLGYSFVPLQADASISLIKGGITAGVCWDPVRSLSLRAYGNGGYFISFINGCSRSSRTPSSRRSSPRRSPRRSASATCWGGRSRRRTRWRPSGCSTGTCRRP
jgi:hypothetical protein